MDHVLEPATTVKTSYGAPPSHTDHRSSWRDSPHDGTSVVIKISSNDGSTGKGILIGMLSAFGSAAFVVLVFAVFYFFRYTNRGRIFLDRIGRPGEFDDEQALAREEADALEDMDDLQRMEYLRAKGALCGSESWKLYTDLNLSLHSSKPTRDFTHRHLTVTILGDTRKGCFGVGIRAGIGDCQLLR